MSFPDDYTPLNYCRICGADFTSLRAFDSHLGGTPEDRYHLTPEEAGLEHRESVMGVERYGLVVSDDEKARLRALSVAGVRSEATRGLEACPA